MFSIWPFDCLSIDKKFVYPPLALQLELHEADKHFFTFLTTFKTVSWQSLAQEPSKLERLKDLLEKNEEIKKARKVMHTFPTFHVQAWL